MSRHSSTAYQIAFLSKIFHKMAVYSVLCRFQIRKVEKISAICFLWILRVWRGSAAEMWSIDSSVRKNRNKYCLRTNCDVALKSMLLKWFDWALYLALKFSIRLTVKCASSLIELLSFLFSLYTNFKLVLKSNDWQLNPNKSLQATAQLLSVDTAIETRRRTNTCSIIRTYTC